MTELAKWKVGRIDEKWKRDVVLQNRDRAIDTINGLNTILFAGTNGKTWNDFEAQISNLRGLTGDEIADQLLAYWNVTQRELAQKVED